MQKFDYELVTIERSLKRNEFATRRLSALEGGLSVVSDLLVKLDAAVVPAANKDGLSDNERKALQIEPDPIISTIGHLARTTIFKGEFLLQAFTGGQLGAVEVSPPEDAAADARPEYLGIAALQSGGRLNLTTGDLTLAQEVVRNAADAIAGSRASVGREMKRLESQADVLQVQYENIAGARSAIADTDYAREVGILARAQVVQKAGLFAVMAARDISARQALALLG